MFTVSSLNAKKPLARVCVTRQRKRKFYAAPLTNACSSAKLTKRVSEIWKEEIDDSASVIINFNS